MSRQAPLPADYFTCPDLSKRETEYFVAKARASAKALVDAARSQDGPIRWTETGVVNNVQLYKGKARHPGAVVDSTEQIKYACAATTIQGSLQEVASLFDHSSTEKVKDFAQSDGDLMDGLVLYTLANSERHMHQITIKWTSLELPSPMLKNRDFVTLECQDTFSDARTGRRGWVRSFHSIKLPCVPDLQRELSFVRGSFYHSGYVFVESDRAGFLDVIFSFQLNFKGNLDLKSRTISALYKRVIKSRFSKLPDLGQMLLRRRLGAQRFLGDLELVPKKSRTHCELCQVKFGLLTRKSRCRKCGQVICQSCSTQWEITVPKVGVKSVRVCSKCAVITDMHSFEDGTVFSSRYSVESESVLHNQGSDAGSTDERFGSAHLTAKNLADIEYRSNPQRNTDPRFDYHREPSSFGPTSQREREMRSHHSWSDDRHRQPPSSSRRYDYDDRRAPPRPRHDDDYDLYDRPRGPPSDRTYGYDAGGRNGDYPPYSSHGRGQYRSDSEDDDAYDPRVRPPRNPKDDRGRQYSGSRGGHWSGEETVSTLSDLAHGEDPLRASQLLTRHGRSNSRGGYDRGSGRQPYPDYYEASPHSQRSARSSQRQHPPRRPPRSGGDRDRYDSEEGDFTRDMPPPPPYHEVYGDDRYDQPRSRSHTRERDQRPHRSERQTRGHDRDYDDDRSGDNSSVRSRPTAGRKEHRGMGSVGSHTDHSTDRSPKSSASGPSRRGNNQTDDDEEDEEDDPTKEYEVLGESVATVTNDNGEPNIVALYQQMLELTKQQQQLDAQADPASKEKHEVVTKDLQELYKKLNHLTMASSADL